MRDFCMISLLKWFHSFVFKGLYRVNFHASKQAHMFPEAVHISCWNADLGLRSVCFPVLLSTIHSVGGCRGL